MNKLDLLSYDRINSNLDLFGKYGKRAIVSDFAILLGANVSNNDYSVETRSLKHRTCSWWLKTNANKKDLFYVGSHGLIDNENCFSHNLGIRPVISYYKIADYCSEITENEFLVSEVEYGEYPQSIVDYDLSEELEINFKNGNIETTGKIYMTDSVWNSDRNCEFIPREHIEYKYKGNKYIRFVGDENCTGKILSDGREIKKGNSYWIKVEPITWLVSTKDDIAICKNIICSGVIFDLEDKKCKFKKSNLKRFMDNYLVNDIVNSIDKKRLEEKENKVQKKKNIFKNLFGKLGFKNNKEKSQEEKNNFGSSRIKRFLNKFNFKKKREVKVDTDNNNDFCIQKIEELLNNIREKIKLLPNTVKNAFENKIEDLLKEYNNSLLSDNRVDFNFLTNNIVLSNEESSPELSLYLGLDNLLNILNSNERTIEVINDIYKYLDLMNQEVLEMPNDCINCSDKIKKVLFYINNFSDYRNNQYRDKLVQLLNNSLAVCNNGIIDLINGSSNSSVNNDKVVDNINEFLDKIINYNQEMITFINYSNKLYDALCSFDLVSEDNLSVDNIIKNSRHVLRSIGNEEAIKLEIEIKNLVNKYIYEIGNYLDNNDNLDVNYLCDIDIKISYELQDILNRMNILVNKNNLYTQIIRSRNIINGNEEEDCKCFSVIEEYVKDIKDAVLNNLIISEDKEIVKKEVNDYLNDLEFKLNDMSSDDIKSIGDCTYFNNSEHALTISQNKLAKLLLLLNVHNNSKVKRLIK